MNRFKIMFFVDWYYPAFKAGGPVKSVHNMVSFLKDFHHVLVVTSNKDIDGTVVELNPNCIKRVNGIDVIYLDDTFQSMRKIAKVIGDFNPDFLHLNSLFSINYTLKPFLYAYSRKKKIVLAPRGMLTEEALKIKPLKKEVFIKLSKFLLRKNRVLFHASTSQERIQIKKNFGEKTRSKIAQNLTSNPIKRVLDWSTFKEGDIRLVYMARVTPIKNLDFFISLLKASKISNFKLDIFGPIEDVDYWNQCKRIIGDDERINYKGVLLPTEVSSLLQEYHFFVMPSGNENYGHSIVESISAGVPVIISDRTPWLGLQKHNVGFDLSLNERSAWSDCLESLKFIALNENEYNKMVKACYKYSLKHISNDKIQKENLNLFEAYHEC